MSHHLSFWGLILSSDIFRRNGPAPDSCERLDPTSSFFARCLCANEISKTVGHTI